MNYRGTDREAALLEWVATKYLKEVIKKTQQPYINHLMEVAEMSACYMKFGFEIGLCHDIIEDELTNEQGLIIALTDLQYNTEEAFFIVATVVELTDIFTKKAFPLFSKAKRKELESNRLCLISAEAQTVKYADLCYNIRWVLSYTPQKAKAYLERKKQLLIKMNKGNPVLHNNVLQVLNEELRK